MSGQWLDAQGFAADMAALEKQFSQWPRAQAGQRFPGALQCAVRGGAARPNHWHTLQQQHHFADVAAAASQIAALFGPQPLAALALHLNLDHPMRPQPRGQRTRGRQPGVQRGIGGVWITAPAMVVGTAVAGRNGGCGTR